MRSLMPVRFERCRVQTIRWHLYALAGKVVIHGRNVYLKLQSFAFHLFQEIFASFIQLAPS